jgi:hypothetical protein
VPTPPDVVRTELASITAAAAAEVNSAATGTNPATQASILSATVPLVLPSYYDAAGALATAWYDELRDAARPSTGYLSTIVGEPSTDWIEREIQKMADAMEADLKAETQRILDETMRLVEKEVARGYQATVIGNVHNDTAAIGWSRVARPGACKFCQMLAGKGAVYSEDTAHFAAHTDCHCAARPEFRGGGHGPEASVEQYVASNKHRTSAQRAQLRKYLNHHYPDAPG